MPLNELSDAFFTVARSSTVLLELTRASFWTLNNPAHLARGPIVALRRGIQVLRI
jgi:hypothetical protein